VYEPAGEVLARGRTVDGRVGFEVITPLRLADGSAVLVDRGWVPVAHGQIATRPQVPPAPSARVSVVGRVHLSESGGHAVDRLPAGGAQVRRIAVPEIARELAYPVYGAYLLADPVEPGFAAVPVRHENAWQNAAYVFQWWLLAVLTVVGFGYLVRREAHAGSAGAGNGAGIGSGAGARGGAGVGAAAVDG
jgi:cytochrome oxidase assembly protein ShyY1